MTGARPMICEEGNDLWAHWRGKGEKPRCDCGNISPFGGRTDPGNREISDEMDFIYIFKKEYREFRGIATRRELFYNLKTPNPGKSGVQKSGNRYFPARTRLPPRIRLGGDL